MNAALLDEQWAARSGAGCPVWAFAREAQLEPCRDIRWQPEPTSRRAVWPDAGGTVPLGRSRGTGARADSGRDRALEKWHAGLPPAALRLLWTYEATRDSIAGEELPFSPYTFRTEEGELTRQLASERERALRLLDLITAQQISLTKGLESRIAQNEEAPRYATEFSILDPRHERLA